MKTGLALGKFHPLHIGHVGLIEFAMQRCDQLIVLICASDKEEIPGEIRLRWVKKTFQNNRQVIPILLNYSEEELPNTSVSSKEVSKKWAEKINAISGNIDIIFSSEPYGSYLAEFMGASHLPYDLQRTINNISATTIRKNVFQNWLSLADEAKPYFVKKVCISGTESTGKSTLAKNLALYYNTNYVPEMAREIIEETEACTEEDLTQIAALHAMTINEKLKDANKVLFVDTDLNITRSYSKYLFGKELKVDNWVEDANQFDLYLFLENDALYVQDGTRLDKERRDKLNDFHKEQLMEKNIEYKLLTGDWQDRFEKSVSIVDKLLDGNR